MHVVLLQQIVLLHRHMSYVPEGSTVMGEHPTMEASFQQNLRRMQILFLAIYAGSCISAITLGIVGYLGYIAPVIQGRTATVVATAVLIVTVAITSADRILNRWNVRRSCKKITTRKKKLFSHAFIRQFAQGYSSHTREQSWTVGTTQNIAKPMKQPRP
jgi:hypothetical protein